MLKRLLSAYLIGVSSLVQAQNQRASPVQINSIKQIAGKWDCIYKEIDSGNKGVVEPQTSLQISYSMSISKTGFVKNISPVNIMVFEKPYIKEFYKMKVYWSGYYELKDNQLTSYLMSARVFSFSTTPAMAAHSTKIFKQLLEHQFNKSIKEKSITFIDTTLLSTNSWQFITTEDGVKFSAECLKAGN